MKYYKIHMVVISQNKDILISLDTHMLWMEESKNHTGETKWQFRVKTPYYGCVDTLLASYSSEEKAREVMRELISYCESSDTVFEFPPDGDIQ